MLKLLGKSVLHLIVQSHHKTQVKTLKCYLVMEHPVEVYTFYVMNIKPLHFENTEEEVKKAFYLEFKQVSQTTK